jgi:hypothetical protein
VSLLRRRTAPMPSGEDSLDPRFNVVPESFGFAYPGVFPGMAGAELLHTESSRLAGWWGEADAEGIEPDWSLGGMPGDVETQPYGTGVVDAGMTEDYSLLGAVSRYRRPAESGVGPVGALDYRSQLAMQIVQSMTPDVYDEASQLSVVGGF